MSVYIDETKIRQAINALIVPDGVFEVRIIKNSGKSAWSGMFKTADSVIAELNKFDLTGKNVYIIPQPLDESCYSMEQRDRFLQGVSGAGDKDVTMYRWLFIDLDPKRKTKVSATDAEREAAFRKAAEIDKFLKEHNFYEPIKAVSGNGAHLLYEVALANTEENRALVHKVLDALDVLFTDENVEVDVSNYNQSKPCKLYGTLAQKGANSPERPHRMSRIISVPEELKVNEKAKLEWLASFYPEEEQPIVRFCNQHQSGSFDIEEWLNKYGVRYKAKPWKDGMKYVLDECPFNPEHKYPDSCITRRSNGKLGFVCFHNSCQKYEWRDVRMKYEPDAYNAAERGDRQIENGWFRHKNADRDIPHFDVNNPIPEEPVWLELKDINNKKEPAAEYISTGYSTIDRKIKGLAKGAVSVLSGMRGSAKSTFLSQMILSMVDNGQTVVCYSGELPSNKFAEWMMLQAAGKRHTIQSQMYENYYYVDNDNTKKMIAEWMAGKFFLYNNKYGNNFDDLAQEFRNQAEKTKADCIVLDNLMAVKLDDKYDKNQAQTDFVWELKNIATQTNTHVIFVAHPRKTQGFLRLDDISGTGNISNIVDSAFILHRKNDDFEKAFAEKFGRSKWNLLPETCTNVLEICKERGSGNQDIFIPLWYEPETKRLLSGPDTAVNYGWETMFNRQKPLLLEQDYFKGETNES